MSSDTFLQLLMQKKVDNNLYNRFHYLSISRKLYFLHGGRPQDAPQNLYKVAQYIIITALVKVVKLVSVEDMPLHSASLCSGGRGEINILTGFQFQADGAQFCFTVLFINQEMKAILDSWFVHISGVRKTRSVRHEKKYFTTNSRMMNTMV